jgi:hypothetical protein
MVLINGLRNKIGEQIRDFSKRFFEEYSGKRIVGFIKKGAEALIYNLPSQENN